ncbi:hypothetical protein [Mycobacterium sp. TY815]|uniref:hypothetical protein n=1 Tax=Mycobacterium sp. TY815 TaxID=3050581 RepID=UPI0027410AF4|nr:hypothetical protein [Mycobacterium sp. TY815]MDP7703356.1 hypothetical protein [Mycobacterium sp. TY815]
MNAVFYMADPADFIRMRTEALSLMACQDEDLQPAYGADRTIGTLRIAGTTPPTRESRERYIRTEAVMIVHHASEALLRLFYAHVDHVKDCPWLGMSASTDFAEFKIRLADAVKTGFNRDEIAMIFLGGTTPADAAIAVPEDDFEDAVDGLQMLLVDCAKRFIEDSFLYNAVKHGLAAVDTDDDMKMVFTTGDGDQIPLHTGSMHMFLHRKRHPAAGKAERQWHFTLADVNPQRELSVSALIGRAIESLWSVARRRYVGSAGGGVYLISKASVELAVYGTVREAMNLLRKITSELIKTDAAGVNDATHHVPIVYEIPREWEPPSGEHDTDNRYVELPVRQQDRRIYSTSLTAYLPITPSGYQRS